MATSQAVFRATNCFFCAVVAFGAAALFAVFDLVFVGYLAVLL